MLAVRKHSSQSVQHLPSPFLASPHLSRLRVPVAWSVLLLTCLTCRQASLPDFFSSAEFARFLVSGLNEHSKKVLCSKKNKILTIVDNKVIVDGARVCQLVQAIRNYIVTRDRKIGHLGMAFITDLQIMFERRSVTAKRKRDTCELATTHTEPDELSSGCDKLPL
jgi:hypothetical protein